MSSRTSRLLIRSLISLIISFSVKVISVFLIWINFIVQCVERRRRVHAGLNKGEARNSLARAVFFNRLGEIRDRSFEQQ
ncbi:hypothetical protein FCZ54_28005, partial [Escherichia coli]|nr:hypothetical protein [Escherichia coli]